jgi:hypothetical protein
MSCNCGNTSKPKLNYENIKNKVNNIVEGWTNLIIGNNKEPFVQRRAKICYLCREKSTINICKICNCYIPAKINVKSEECPKKMWLKVS